MVMTAKQFNVLSKGAFNTWNLTRAQHVDGHYTNATYEGCLAKAEAINSLLDLEEIRVAARKAGSIEALEYACLSPDLLNDMADDLCSVFNFTQKCSTTYDKDYTGAVANARASQGLVKISKLST